MKIRTRIIVISCIMVMISSVTVAAVLLWFTYGSMSKEAYAEANKDAYTCFNDFDINIKKYAEIDDLDVYAEYYLTSTGKLEEYNVIESTFDQEDYAVGVRKDDQALADKINAGLKELQENGTFAEISMKWFGEDVTPKN